MSFVSSLTEKYHPAYRQAEYGNAIVAGAAATIVAAEVAIIGLSETANEALPAGVAAGCILIGGRCAVDAVVDWVDRHF